MYERLHMHPHPSAAPLSPAVVGGEAGGVTTSRSLRAGDWRNRLAVDIQTLPVGRRHHNSLWAFFLTFAPRHWGHPHLH